MYATLIIVGALAGLFVQLYIIHTIGRTKAVTENNNIMLRNIHEKTTGSLAPPVEIDESYNEAYSPKKDTRRIWQGKNESEFD